MIFPPTFRFFILLKKPRSETAKSRSCRNIRVSPPYTLAAIRKSWRPTTDPGLCKENGIILTGQSLKAISSDPIWIKNADEFVTKIHMVICQIHEPAFFFLQPSPKRKVFLFQFGFIPKYFLTIPYRAYLIMTLVNFKHIIRLLIHKERRLLKSSAAD